MACILTLTTNSGMSHPTLSVRLLILLHIRVNYAHLWLSLIAPPSAQTYANRRKYAQLVGKIDPEMYPVFESAITVSSTRLPLSSFKPFIIWFGL